MEDAYDRDPYGPVARMGEHSRYCDCDAGVDLRTEELAESVAAMEAEAAARDWADARAEVPDWHPCYVPPPRAPIRIAAE
ncbi:MAG: hypothetical protein QM594_10080 [Niabella sp.]